MAARVAALHAAVRPQQEEQRGVGQLRHVDVEQRQPLAHVGPRHGRAVPPAAVLLLRVAHQDGVQGQAGVAPAQLGRLMLAGEGETGRDK